MPKKRSPDPALLLHRYHSPNIPMAAIRHYARQIAERFQPDKIILFGSYAYGTPHEDSDVDLLVVMPAYNEINQSIRICVALPAPFSLDLIVRKPEHLHWDPDDVDWFLREVLEKGKVLYEKKDRSVGTQGRRRLGNGKKTRPRKDTLP
jgi:predicted nucleotidyltransferase